MFSAISVLVKVYIFVLDQSIHSLRYVNNGQILKFPLCAIALIHCPIHVLWLWKKRHAEQVWQHPTPEGTENGNNDYWFK